MIPERTGVDGIPRLGRVAAFLLGLLLLEGILVATPARACAAHLLAVRLSGFPHGGDQDRNLYFYYAAEETATTPFVVRAIGDDCDAVPIVASYEAADYPSGTRRATSPVDYTAQAGTTAPLYGNHGTPNTHAVDVPIHDDSLPEPAVERIRVRISPDGTTGRIIEPSDVPMYIVDDDGLTRATLEGRTYRSTESDSTVAIPVFRAGPEGAAAVPYEVVGSGAAPATAGTDFTVSSPNPLQFTATELVKFVTVRLVDDTAGEGDEEITVRLTGAAVEEPAATTVTIVDNEEAVPTPPVSRFHHPQHGVRYPKTDYRIREMHVFAKDVGVAGLDSVQLALRTDMKTGRARGGMGTRSRPGRAPRSGGTG